MKGHCLYHKVRRPQLTSGQEYSKLGLSGHSSWIYTFSLHQWILMILSISAWSILPVSSLILCSKTAELIINIY